jgi:hypothetical protein
MKYALLFGAVYAALFLHRIFFRDTAPVPLTTSSEWVTTSPRESIRSELAREKEGTGPLSQAFEAIATGTTLVEAVDTGPFAFLYVEGEGSAKFLENLLSYASSPEASSVSVQLQVLDFALKRAERQNAPLISIATQILEDPENFGAEAGSVESLELSSHAAKLLSQQIPDLAEFESLAQSLKLLHARDSSVTQALDEILVARRAGGTN